MRKSELLTFICLSLRNLSNGRIESALNSRAFFQRSRLNRSETRNKSSLLSAASNMAFALSCRCWLRALLGPESKAKNPRTCVPFRDGMQYVTACERCALGTKSRWATAAFIHSDQRADLSGKKQPAHSLYIHVHGKDINSDGFIPWRLHFATARHILCEFGTAILVALNSHKQIMKMKIISSIERYKEEIEKIVSFSLKFYKRIY